MTEIEIRLECLKLAHTLGRETAQVVERATEYETYVKGPAVAKNTLTLNKADNPKWAG